MNLKLSLLLAYTAIALTVAAQVEGIFAEANKQYMLYEEERDKDSDAMYDHILQSYKLFIRLLDQETTELYTSAAKSKLKSIYTVLPDAFIRFSNNGEYKKAYPFGLAYIKLPSHKAMASELLSKHANHSQILFNTGLTASELNDDDNAIYCLKEYISSGETARAKDCYDILITVYKHTNSLEKQLEILNEAIEAFPTERNFRYNLVNIYIDTNDDENLLKAVNGILSIDPNDAQALPMKAKLEMKNGNLEEARKIYKLIYSLNSEDSAIMQDLAICDFSLAVWLNQRLGSNPTEGEKMRYKQESYPYVSEASTLFEAMLSKQPKNYDYMNALGQCYRYLDKNEESTALSIIIRKKLSFHDFPQITDSIKRTGPTPDSNPAAIILEQPNLVTSNVLLHEGNENNILEGGESFIIEFTLENRGVGDAENVHIRFTESGLMDQYIKGAREIFVGTMAAKTQQKFTMSYTVDENTPNGTAAMFIYVLEGNGFDAASRQINIKVKEMSRPRLRITDSEFESIGGTKISKGGKGRLWLMIQNYGTAGANHTEIQFNYPDNIYPAGNNKFTFDTIQAGDTKVIAFDFILNNRYLDDSVAIQASIKEASNYELISSTFKVGLDTYLSPDPIIINPDDTVTENVTIKERGFFKEKDELLQDVPQGITHQDRYALIIGNERYDKYIKRGAEVNVPYAVNDARAFREYCLQTFGIPYDNIVCIENASTGQMKEEVGNLINIGNSRPQVELFFFYSGHGFPDEETHMPYLLPADLTGRNVTIGISLNDLYKSLSNCKCKGAYVFLDACFSGGFKSDKPLVEAKSSRIIIDTTPLTGNTISFTSSRGNQTSSVYHDKKHGLFTYYLLKAIKDSKGDIDFGELYEQTRQGVASQSARLKKPQEPQVIPSDNWSNWESFKLYE